MKAPEIDKRSYPEFWERLSFAVKAFMYIFRNKPIIVCLDEGTVYARSNPQYLRAYSNMLDHLAESQEVSDLEIQIRRLLEQEDVRKN